MIRICKCPEGYTLIPVDLNEGAGGDWIYLCYSTINDSRLKNSGISLINSLYIDSSEKNRDISSQLGNGYTRVNLDLNRRAGGDYIYLYSSKSNDYSKKRIGGIKVISTDKPLSAEQMKGFDDYDFAGFRKIHYTPINVDLNKNARGKFIYIMAVIDKYSIIA